MKSLSLLTVLPVVAWAQNTPDLQAKIASLEAQTRSAQSAGDNAWMLVSAALVLMMTGPGLALVLRRPGAPQERALHHDAQLHPDGAWSRCSGPWWATAWPSAKGLPFIGDLRYAFLNGVGARPMPDYAGTIPQQTFMIYQLMFAIITPALISGAFAERMKFSAMLLFTDAVDADGLLPDGAHGVGQRRLAERVRRAARFPASISPAARWCTSPPAFRRWCARCIWASGSAIRTKPMKPHSLVLSFIGACLLWVGWFGFNAGSALAASSLATSAFVATHFAAAAAALGWMFAEWMQARASPACWAASRARGRTGGHHAGFRIREAVPGAADRLAGRAWSATSWWPR